jgi:hypothetical protein
MFEKENSKIMTLSLLNHHNEEYRVWLGTVAQACNPSYSGRRDQEDQAKTS